MNKLKLFIIDFSVVSLGNVLSRLLAALIAIVVARVLCPESFGKFSILFAVMTIVASGLSGIDLTYIHNRSGQIKIRRFSYSNYVFFKISISVLFIAIGISFSPYINKYIFNNEITSFALIISFFSALSFIAYTQVYTFYQAEQNFKKFSYIQVEFYFLVLLGIIIISYLKITTYYIYLFPYMLIGIVIFILFVFIGAQKIHFEKVPFVKIFQQGKWIILSEICVVLLTRLDFLILSHYIKGETLGFYSAAMRIINIYLTFTAAFSAIMLPKASRIKDERQKRLFYKASFLLSLFLILLNIILIFSSSTITRILFGDQYLPSIKFTQLLLIAYIPFTLYQPFRYLTYTFDKTNILFLVPFLQNIMLLITGPLFIHKSGPLGIIMAKTIVFILGFIIFFISVFKKKIPNSS